LKNFPQIYSFIVPLLIGPIQKKLNWLLFVLIRLSILLKQSKITLVWAQDNSSKNFWQFSVKAIGLI